jgi:tetratricopeptide (TPR) repeat protein
LVLVFRVLVLAIPLMAGAETPDPSWEPLNKAYSALQARKYDEAIRYFEAASALSPARASIHKDLGYTLLKIGETELARDRFADAMRLEPGDSHVALEYAFLCYETKQQAAARRVFDRLRRQGNSVAEQAFRNIDEALAAGIARWARAVELTPTPRYLQLLAALNPEPRRRRESFSRNAIPTFMNSTRRWRLIREMRRCGASWPTCTWRWAGGGKRKVNSARLWNSNRPIFFRRPN